MNWFEAWGGIIETWATYLQIRKKDLSSKSSLSRCVKGDELQSCRTQGLSFVWPSIYYFICPPCNPIRPVISPVRPQINPLRPLISPFKLKLASWVLKSVFLSLSTGLLQNIFSLEALPNLNTFSLRFQTALSSLIRPSPQISPLMLPVSPNWPRISPLWPHINSQRPIRHQSP